MQLAEVAQSDTLEVGWQEVVSLKQAIRIVLDQVNAWFKVRGLRLVVDELLQLLAAEEV